MTHEFWYLSRAAGVTAYLLLFAVSMLGIAMSARVPQWLIRRNFTFELHRFITLVALALTAFHAYVLLGDSFFNFSIASISIPFASPYRPLQVGIGVLAFWSLIIVTASFYVRRFIGYRAWRMIHVLSFALFAGATFHGITAGSDSGEGWARLMYLGAASSFAAFTLYRIEMSSPAAPYVRALRTSGAFATAFAAFALPIVLFQAGSTNSSATPTATTSQVARPATDSAFADDARERFESDDDDRYEDEHEERDGDRYEHESEERDDDDRYEHERYERTAEEREWGEFEWEDD